MQTTGYNGARTVLTYISGNNISSLAISIFWNKDEKSQNSTSSKVPGLFLKVPRLPGPFLPIIWDFLKFSQPGNVMMNELNLFSQDVLK